MLEKGLYQLIKQYGSRQHLAHRLGIHESYLSQVISGHDVSVRLAMKIDVLSKGDVPAEHLLKHCGKWDVSRAMRQLKLTAQSQVVTHTPLAYVVKKPLLTLEDTQNAVGLSNHVLSDTNHTRPLLVDETDTLLFGPSQRKGLEARGLTTVEVLIVHLEKLLETRQPIITPYPLTLLERFAMGLRLEQRIKHMPPENPDYIALKPSDHCPNLDPRPLKKASGVREMIAFVT